MSSRTPKRGRQEPMPSHAVAALLRRPGFTRYFATVAAVRATGTMFSVAGVLLILQRTHDLTLAGVVIAAATLTGVANAFEGASFNAAFIVGPALAGLIAGVAGPAAAIDVQLFSGLALAVLIAGDATFELRPPNDDGAPRGVLQAVREGLTAMW